MQGLSPLFAYCFQLSPVPPISPSSCKPFRALLVVFCAKTSKVVGKIVKSVNKVKVLKTVKIRKQVIDLFDKIKPNNQITIGYKKLTALPKNYFTRR
jgi:hypothetical protein